MPGGAVTLRTDINQFYPSIYTHAVDWAVRTKRRAKKAKNAQGLGPELDKRLRNSRSGQTVGLSIGPDTSWLVSELVLGRVDEALTRKFPIVTKRAVRFGDDMLFYASSIEEAHEVLGEYERCLAEYELSLNATKVAVVGGLEAADPSWVSTLRRFQYRDATEDQLAQDLIDLFAFAHEIARSLPTQGVLSYAIKRCNPFPAGKRTWPIYRDLVLASITQEASTLRHVYEILMFAKQHALAVDQDAVVDVLNEVCARHASFDHGFEVAWILTILRDLNLPLDAATANAIATMNDNCSLILLIDAVQRAPFTLNGVDTSAALSRAELKGALSSEDWLLAYESRVAKWCAPRAWDGLPQWEGLKKAGVRFFVPSPPTRFRGLRRTHPRFMPTWGGY
jgi:hypothetical protein